MDESLQRIARPHGILTTAALLKIGFSRRYIQKLEQQRLITRIRDGAFKVGSEPPTRVQELAAIQAISPACVISHFDAASIWNFFHNAYEGVIEVSVQRPYHVNLAGVWCHQTRHHPNDVVVHDGLSVTSPARTLFDMSFVLSTGQLGQNYQDLQFRKLINFTELRRVCQSLGPAKWRRTVRVNKVVEERSVADGKTQSNEEILFYRTLIEAGLPEPKPQFPVLTDIGLLHVDFAYAQRKIAMEVDAHPSHRTPEGIRRDKERTAALERAGWCVLRFQSGDSLSIINDVSEALAH